MTVFWRAIISVDSKLFLLSIFMFFPAQLLAAYRWHIVLLTIGKPLYYWDVLRHNLLGQVSAIFLPGQLSGDIVRTVSISSGKREKAFFILSVLLDKLALLAAIAALALIGSIFSRQLDSLYGLSVISLGFLLGALILMILLARYRPRMEFASRFLDHLKSYLPETAQKLSHGLQTSSSVPCVKLNVLGNIFLLGVMLQVVNTLGGFLLIQAMVIPVDFLDWMAINAIVTFAQVLPISIGGLGVRESILSFVLLLYGVSPGISTAFSLLSFVFLILLTWISWFISDTLFRRGVNHDSPDFNQA
jgi:hypothetical protein